MKNRPSHYSRAGVDLDAGHKAVDLIKTAVRSTYTDAVLSDTGNFGGLFAIDSFKNLQSPVLVASTDGVGTKTRVAARLNRWHGIGQDLVNHCVNDILVQGARPLFFLDYVASSKLIPEQIAQIVAGMAEACKSSGCALLGGETAEMPGVYAEGEVDVVGTVVGIVDKPLLIDGSSIKAGDVIFGLPSTGLHTNGYSLARQALSHLDWEVVVERLGTSIGDAMLAVHRCYLPHITDMQDGGVSIHGLAHITGGGIVDNLPRILPAGTQAVIKTGTWPVTPVFDLIQESAGIDVEEMYRVFNMGLGMLAVVPEQHKDQCRSILADDGYLVGHITDGNGKVEFEG